MDVAEGHGEFEPISTVRDHLFDDIGTKPLVIEFLHWAGHPDILQAKPHLVTNIILWGFALEWELQVSGIVYAG